MYKLDKKLAVMEEKYLTQFLDILEIDQELAHDDDFFNSFYTILFKHTQTFKKLK